MSTRNAPLKITRLRCCDACGNRWTTIEVAAADVQRMEAAVSAVRSFASLSREFDDAAAAHG